MDINGLTVAVIVRCMLNRTATLYYWNQHNVLSIIPQ